MRAYLAAPLCSEAEREFNLRLRSFVQSIGIETYLPQEDGGHLSSLVSQGLDEDLARSRLFDADMQALAECDMCIALLDGRVPDEGVCFELGVAHSLGKRCVGFKTDSRSAIRGRDNLMIEGALEGTARTWQGLRQMLLSGSGEAHGT